MKKPKCMQHWRRALREDQVLLGFFDPCLMRNVYATQRGLHCVKIWLSGMGVEQGANTENMAQKVCSFHAQCKLLGAAVYRDWLDSYVCAVLPLRITFLPEFLPV